MTQTTSPGMLDRFKNLSSNTRTGLIGGCVVFAIAIVGTFLSDNSMQPKNKAKAEPQNVVNNSTRNTTNEDLAGELEQAKKEIAAQRSKLALLEEYNRQKREGNSVDGRLTEIDTLVTQIQVMQERLTMMESGSGANPRPAGKTTVEAPTGSAGGGELVLGADGQPVTAANNAATRPMSASPSPAESRRSAGIQVVVAEKRAPAQSKVAAKQVPAAYITSGANFEAILLNGMDASTAINANKTPIPALLRIKTEAILPGMFTFDVRECFVMVGGFGNMSSERVEMRTESMSCIDQAGAVWEGKIEGYVVGEDGKAGARGRVVSKQGALLAKSFMAGFIGGIGGAFTPQAVPSVNLNSGGTNTTQGYQYPAMDQVLGSGIGKGLNQSATALANFYISLAEQMFPVVELDAGRKMTIILLKGVELKMDNRR